MQPRKKKFMDQVRDKIRLTHYSLKRNTPISGGSNTTSSIITNAIL